MNSDLLICHKKYENPSSLGFNCLSIKKVALKQVPLKQLPFPKGILPIYQYRPLASTHQ